MGPIGLAVVAPMAPDAGAPAVRTRRRTVDLGVRKDSRQVLNQADDAPYNSMHRSVSVECVKVSITNHDTNGVPAYLACDVSQAEAERVLTNAQKDPETSGADGPGNSRDATLRSA